MSVHGFDFIFILEKSSVGYLLMEYFPLGNISSIFEELTKLDECTDEIQRIDNLMLNSQSNEEFGKQMIPWQKAVKMRNKITDCCKRLWHSIIDSLKHFHDQNLVHLDIKGSLLYVALSV